MENISLKKEILPGTWRFLGLRCPDINPSEVPIAGNIPHDIAKKIGGECYRIGRFKVENAFLVVKDNARFLYVRPKYSGYRKVATRAFSAVPWDVDFDHALAKRIAVKANPSYNYVLLLRVPPSVNRQHGSCEKKDQLNNTVPPMCFADDRILDKWLGRPPLVRRRSQNIMSGYSHANATTYGLTLKQLGRWAYAIGMGDKDLSMLGLEKIKSDS